MDPPTNVSQIAVTLKVNCVVFASALCAMATGTARRCAAKTHEGRRAAAAHGRGIGGAA